MRRALRFSTYSDAWACPAVVWASLTLAGCGGAPPQDAAKINAAPPATTGEKDHGHDHGHAHASEGPHHGDLVELGNEEYHAEIVHGDGGSITIYILDGSAKNAVPIESTEVILNVTHEGKPEQFRLPASPEASDGAGKSSKFHIVNAELAGHLDEENSSAKLVVTVSGKQFTGKVEHHHDDEHDHSHKK
ncbi:hypothetical protein Pan44_51000 [Caulifigura coniformis]|uniref:Uncharacterized protein n=1 Tax=Caulifigura coniformis TaxID=2527983 RepID=A0A517SLN5_9PLAN|nr:hypothetical protein [Caulifigura coniformis]QDT57035.1 hypothetical protein Pan44_51000 [Caulifigura coniformis]